MAVQEYIEGNGFIAEVIRTTRRKSATIKVDDRVVSVVVPENLSSERVRSLLKEKNRWIKEKLAKQKAVQPVTPKEFVSGESFSYLGKNYRLKVKRGPFKPVKLIEGRLVATLPAGPDKPHMVRNALVRWYRTHAKPKLEEKTTRYAEIIGVDPTDVRIKTFKARWGSCNAKGEIDYNWRIIMAPHPVVDYVVVHELCHLKHFNHSGNYWRQVERTIPEFRDHQAWLKVHSGEMVI